ncbi:hypothetical protein [uncultured Roseibium sp.]|uniref:hypothetical protein n=1 Tax=uncultured Roseibium sp. TaxID=1936171 RepID=UPI002636E5F2|nr:hypothetical protein [uncultured Roseibium sp.]
MTALYIHDANIYDAGLRFKQGPAARHLKIPKNQSIGQMTKAVQAVCGPRNHYTVVVFNAHGNKDTINIGAGITHTHTCFWKAVGDALFTKNRDIEIHSCLFAATRRARNMTDARAIEKYDTANNAYSSHALKVIAKSAGCIVKAGTGFQLGQSASGEGDTDGRFETSWVKVNPVGTSALLSADAHPREH